MNPTSLASAARILWRLLEYHGLDSEEVFREAGLDSSMMSDSRARFGDANTRAAWGGAALAGLALGTSAGLGWMKVSLLIVLGILVAVGAQLHASVITPPCGTDRTGAGPG